MLVMTEGRLNILGERLFLLILFFSFNINLYSQNQDSFVLDTILFTKIDFSEMKNCHYEVYNDNLYIIHYNETINHDTLVLEKYDFDSFQLEKRKIKINGISKELKKLKKWNVSSINKFFHVNNDTILIAFGNSILLIDNHNQIISRMNDLDWDDIFLLNGQIVITHYNNYSFNVSNSKKLDNISFFTIDDGDLKFVMDHSFKYSEAFSIRPNHFIDVQKDRMLITDLNGKISLYDSEFNLLDEMKSINKESISEKKMFRIRKGNKHFVDAMTSLSTYLYDSMNHFCREIHFVNDSSFILFRKLSSSDEIKNRFSITFYSIKDDKISFDRVETDNYVDLGSLIFDKNNLPLQLPAASSTLLRNNKLVKLYGYGVNENPIGFSFNSWTELLNKKMMLGKFFIEFHLYDVLEN